MGDQPHNLTPLVMTYTNWRGETSVRSILPTGIWFGTTEWHPEPQWFLNGADLQREEARDFALKDFGHPAPRSHPIPLKWGEYKALGGRTKWVADDLFGHEFARLDVTPATTPSEIEAFKLAKQREYDEILAKALGAAPSPSRRTVWTYKDQPSDNVDVWRLGEACRKSADDPKCGDPIDRGLILLRELEAKGYGIVQLPPAPTGGA